MAARVAARLHRRRRARGRCLNLDVRSIRATRRSPCLISGKSSAHCRCPQGSRCLKDCHHCNRYCRCCHGFFFAFFTSVGAFGYREGFELLARESCGDVITAAQAFDRGTTAMVARFRQHQTVSGAHHFELESASE